MDPLADKLLSMFCHDLSGGDQTGYQHGSLSLLLPESLSSADSV